MSDVRTTARGHMSTTRRIRIFEAGGGLCHLCDRRIQAGEKWEVEHVIPLALGGADGESNMRPAHVKCHAIKTKADNAAWSKSKRMKAKHVGAARKRSSFPCGKDSPWRKKINGTVERRT